MKKVTDYLVQLGLSEIEARLYQGLLEISPCTVMDVADHVSVKRITAHFGIANLINKGLVSESRRGARRRIIVEPPEHLNYLIEQKEKNIKRIKNDYPDILKTIYSSIFQTSASENINIKYYEGKDTIKSLYKEILSAKKIFAFVNSNKIQAIFPENATMFDKALKYDPEKEIWDIFEATKETRKIVKHRIDRHHYCFFPPNVAFSDFDFVIFDNSVAMIYLHIDKPYAIVSHSQAMASGLKAIHSIVWKVLSGAGY